MNFYSAYAGLAVLLVVVLAAASPWGRLADAPPQQGRTENAIDGLRGFLASAVFIHHAAIYREYLIAHVWRLPPSHFYTLCGQEGVAAFFMVTAFLFWGRVQASPIRWPSFYVARIFRIAPLYLCAAAVVVVVALLVGPGEGLIPLLRHIACWATLGLKGMPGVNGYAHTPQLVAGVNWSLRYEWGFYAALFALAWVKRWPIAVSALGLLACLIATARHPDNQPHLASCWAMFFAGMLCASLPRKDLGTAGSVLLCGLLAAIFLTANTAYAPMAILLTGAAFYLIASGANFFGLLTSRPAIRLGNVSYGVYLLQGLCLASVFAMPGVRDLALASALTYWLACGAAALLLVTISAALHVVIERPCIAAGKALAARLPATSLRPGASGLTQSNPGLHNREHVGS